MGYYCFHMKKLLFIIATVGLSAFCSGAEFKLFDEKESAEIFIAADERGFVKLAADDLKSDIKKVGNAEVEYGDGSGKKGTLYIGTADNAEFKKRMEKFGVDLKELEGKFECYKMQNVGENSFAVIGSDARGTMFGIYEFCEKYLGVQPLHFFSGLQPQKKRELKLSNVSTVSKEPSVKYRGWFINDEDFLSEFYDNDGRRNIDYQFYSQVVSPKLMAHVMEALVRAKFNLIIPASFMDISNTAEAALLDEAAKRGVYVSAHHIEPLGVSGYTFFNYWRAKGEKDIPFSYFSAKEKMLETWRHYAEKWAKLPDVIWQIGLRGVGDRPMWFADKKIPDSDEFRGKIISEALAEQVAIVKEFDKRDTPPMTMTLWGEGALLYEKGFLKIPDGVMIIFSDNCPGWKMQDDFNKIERKKGIKYGIYYHHQLWGCGPHMAHGVPPSQTAKVLKDAAAKNSAEYVIMNVSNIREFVIGIETSAKSLADLSSVDGDGGLQNFAQTYFPEHADKIIGAYKKYYASFSMHPERNVPFWLDGNLRNETLSNFRHLKRTFASEKSLDRVLKQENDPNAKKSKKNDEMKRFVTVMLGDAYPDKGSYEFRLKYIDEQVDSFAKTSREIEELANSLPPRERDFLRCNLLSHSFMMHGYSLMCKYSVLARIALKNGDLNECLHNLKMAANAVSLVEKGMSVNSQGKWKDWYKGDKKMNVEDMKDKMGESIKRIEKFLENRENPKPAKAKSDSAKTKSGTAKK